jgi:hypothetical protein
MGVQTLKRPACWSEAGPRTGGYAMLGSCVAPHPITMSRRRIGIGLVIGVLARNGNGGEDDGVSAASYQAF